MSHHNGTLPLLCPMTECEKAWLGGLLEGEGYFGASNNGKGGIYFLITVKMTNKEVIEQVALLFNRKPFLVKSTRPNWKDQYCVTIRGNPAIKVAYEISPWLSRTRSIQIKKALIKCGKLQAA